MPEIMSLLMTIKQILPSVTWGQLLVIVPSILTVTGPITMLNISRWSRKGGSYRTIQRFYNSEILWLQVNWLLMGQSLVAMGGPYVLVGDETVVTKSGKCTHGLDYFFSSIYGRFLPGLSFFGIEVVSIKEGESTSLQLEQLIKEGTTSGRASNPKPKTKKKKGGRNNGGRPKGYQQGARIKIMRKWNCQSIFKICNYLE